MAAVGERAQRLYADGYAARWKDGTVLTVTNPKGEEYEVDTLLETCTCPFFTKGEGKRPCKHLLGQRQLLEDQSRHALGESPGLTVLSKQA